MCQKEIEKDIKHAVELKTVKEKEHKIPKPMEDS